MNTVLEVKDLCKTYVTNKRQNNVLRNVNFKVRQGEMLAVMGPSGSGKSTLLYAVSGMDSATAGSVRFGEKELTAMNQKQLAELRLNEMGFIFQQMFMLKNLSILDNVILPAFQSKKNTASRSEKTEYGKSLLRKLGIIEVADNDISEVSGGQLQRACICRSLVNHPQMIFADEPTGALNRTASQEVMEQLQKVNDDGTTILMVTHDVRVAARCGRVLYIQDGGIASEKVLGPLHAEQDLRVRERELNNWLVDQGW